MPRYSNRYASDFHDESWRVGEYRRSNAVYSGGDCEINAKRREEERFQADLIQIINQSGLIKEGEITKGYGDFLNGCGMWKESSNLFYVSKVEKIRNRPFKAQVVEGGWTTDELIKRFWLDEALVTEIEQNFHDDYHEVYRGVLWVWNGKGEICAYQIGTDWKIQQEEGWFVQAWTDEVPRYLNTEMKIGIDSFISE